MQLRSLVGKTPWRRARQPTPLFLPGEPRAFSHGQTSLVDYSPQGLKELDMTEVTEPSNMHTRKKWVLELHVQQGVI